MIDTAHAMLEADGWSIMDDDGFINLIGPLWRRTVCGAAEYAIVGQEKHRNKRGVVQGGLLMTMADRSCGMTAREAAKVESLATVQFDTHFIAAAQIGDTIVSRPRVVRSTRSLIFMAAEVSVGERCVATSVGVFKVVRKPG